MAKTNGARAFRVAGGWAIGDHISFGALMFLLGALLESVG
jgi:hypothetical protein